MKKIFNINDVRYIDVVSFGNEKGHMLSNSLSSGPPGTLPPGSIPQPGVPNGYAPLDINIKIPPKFLPTSTGTPHHIFATQAAMLAGGALIKAGENVLVHGDPIAAHNGEYVALKDAPTLITDYDNLGEHVASHRHPGDDVDITIGTTTTTLTAKLTQVDAEVAKKFNLDGSIGALSLPLVSLNSTQIAAVKNNSFFMDETQKLKWKDNTGAIKLVTLTP